MIWRPKERVLVDLVNSECIEAKYHYCENRLGRPAANHPFGKVGMEISFE
jgi:hypothetical protein